MPPVFDRPRPTRSAGFTLIETLVALVVLATALFAFYQFLASALSGAAAADRASAFYDRRQNALAVAATLNPMETPEGSLDLGLYHIRWRAVPLGPTRQSSRFPRGTGQFIVALYRVVLDVPEEPSLPAVEVTKFGYRRAPPPGGAEAAGAN